MPVHAQQLTVATFNVSMEAENYLPIGETVSPQVLIDLLKTDSHPQIKNIAAIIQRVRPDIILLNEFDYIADPALGVKAFIKNYLNTPQAGSEAIDYPYYFYSTVNTGQPSPFDLDNDGKATGVGADAWGYGFYPGQYGMLLLSKYPIKTEQVRTFQHFKWKDMPDYLPTKKADGSRWYSDEAWQQIPLSSKSHWDIPILVGQNTVHMLASHPTPPVFDGPENRNGKRNHDEIRFWTDYLTPASSSYIYDDKGQYGGLAENNAFIILGDLNASINEGDAIKTGIQNLLAHPRLKSESMPHSAGGAAHTPDNPHGRFHTAVWRMQVDYVLPSTQGFKVLEKGVFWPEPQQADYRLVGSRDASSDHRLVWLKLAITD
ncbi:endonuclease/exonuclease/phosphatase family protein [Arsukibacterium sp.]|uniref:endonuclease/exonuclease/phosphatase family protein n=1 Tax=Arsukibacterium sp. TaxID=1977258 RepID=UPI002FDA73A5